jgi:DNA repair protein RadA/Sms
MAKSKTVFFCQNCGTESPKWIGRCPSCKEWNTYVEELVSPEKSSRKSFSENPGRNQAKLIQEIRLDESKRTDTTIEELNRVLGGGLVPGSVILLGGEPGIGKSTLALQLGLSLKDQSILYVTGEESLQQIRLRAERIRNKNEKLLILSETSLENILEQLQNIRPSFVIIDSIQTLYTERIESTPGSVSQIRECAASLLRFAKETGTPVLLIGHITKDGTIAGPKVLEHIVDVVLQFEGDTQHIYRLLRASKNRFGSTSELGIFEMQNDGLREVANPSEILMGRHEDNLSGIAVAATIEGIRPFLVETQALVSTAAYGTPQRSTTGFDIRRLHMLLAVLEKRAGFKLIARDVFLNIAGGFKVTDPATDLAIISAVLSSSADIAIPGTYCFSAEIGLSGEIRPVNRTDQRVSEAEKLGFSKIFVSKYAKVSSKSTKKIEIVSLSRVEQLLSQLFG